MDVMRMFIKELIICDSMSVAQKYRKHKIIHSVVFSLFNIAAALNACTE